MKCQHTKQGIQLIFLDMKGKDLSECYLKVHLPQLYCTFPSSIKPLRGDVQSGEALSQYIAHHHPQLFMGVLEKTGCTKENEFRNKKKSFRI